MRTLAMLIFLGLIAGCASTPRNADEWRQHVLDGAAMTTIKGQEVNRPFSVVYDDIKANAVKCLNVTVTGTSSTRYGHMTESVPYHTTVTKTGDTTGQLVVQQNKKIPANPMPEGGYFVMLADIEATSPSSTRITVYGPAKAYNSVYEALFFWARGETEDCPILHVVGSGQSVSYHNR